MIEINDRGFYVASDFHLFHTNIIKYCDRPFADADEMNRTLVDNWNDTVSDDDVIFFLGDFIFGRNSKNAAREVWAGLNGKKKYFLMGNHDHRIKNFCEDVVAENSHQTVEVSYRGLTFTLSHRPVSQFSTNFHIHGHSHGNNEGFFRRHVFDASVDNTDFKPIHVDDVLRRIIQQNKDVIDSQNI